MWDVCDRLDERVQLTSDGHGSYLQAVHGAFGDEIDYARLVKLYGAAPESDTRYSPAQCIGARREVVSGSPEARSISTSYIERSHLTLRTMNRRYTRLTNGYSRKYANHVHALALHYFAYNFIKRHSTLKTTPAVAARIEDREWTIMDLVKLLEDEERKIASGGRINREDRT
jgi:hypothetical protein